MTDAAKTCDHCGDLIRWMVTPAGKRMPVDAVPDRERGNVVVLGRQVAVLNPRQADAARARGVEAFLDHAVSCPYASRWKDKKLPAAARTRRRG